MSKENAIEKLRECLFKPKDQIEDKLSKSEIDRMKRIELCISKKLEEPFTTDREIVEYLTTGCTGVCPAISSAQAYRDIVIINLFTGNISLAAKNWERYAMVEVSKKWANAAASKGDYKAAAAHNKNIIIVRQLNTEDKENLLAQMPTPNYEITGDPSVLDDGENIPKKTRDYEKRRKELRELYNSNEVQDVEAEYIDEDDQSK